MLSLLFTGWPSPQFWSDLSLNLTPVPRITTDGQSASLSWNTSKAPIWGLRPDIYYCFTVTVLFLWGALSDERTYLSFVHAADLCQRSHSRVRVPGNSRPYFTVSDFRLLFSSSPTTRSVTMEVFDPASTRVWSDLGFLLYDFGAGRQRKCLSISFPRKRLFITQQWTVSKNLSPLKRVCLPVTGWFPRILHGNVFADPFPSNGFTCHSIFTVWVYINYNIIFIYK
jgi:hypothetical protein